MGEEINPADDRDEFIIRINSIYDYAGRINEREFRRAVILNDTVKLQEFVDNIAIWDTALGQALTDYDAALDRDGRIAVVGSITTEGLPTVLV